MHSICTRVSSVVVVLGLFLSQPALAHDWHIQAVEYEVPKPGATTLFMGWGHALPLDDPMRSEKIAKLQLIAPDGSVSDLPVAPGISYHFTPVDLNAPGTYTVIGESKPGYYHMYLDKDGKMHHTARALDELQEAARVLFSVRAFQNPKCYLAAGEPADDAAAPRPVGAKFEIVLDQAPGAIHAGDRLSFRVLLDGNPLPDGSTFDATHLGYSTAFEDYLFTKRPIAGGKGQIDLPCAGVWYIRAHHFMDAPDDMKAKCRQYMYNTTLTVLVKKPKPRRPMAPH